MPGKRERVLLTYLALSPSCRQPRRKLTTLLWGDAADETTLDNLRNCLWSLRKALGGNIFAAPLWLWVPRELMWWTIVAALFAILAEFAAKTPIFTARLPRTPPLPSDRL